MHIYWPQYRGMRVDLAIKNKALQRLTRECKKTIRKIQKEKEAFKYERSHSTAASSSSSKATLKTLQTAHERELANCHETVRLLQQRLNERDEQFALQKRRKVPVDYYALKAK
ncbi:hypothetical protein DOY81_011627, partial [Sarcophaga bullata]